jgi:hypothetical protein
MEIPAAVFRSMAVNALHFARKQHSPFIHLSQLFGGTYEQDCSHGRQQLFELKRHTGQNSKERGAEVSFIEQRRLTACSIVTQYPFFFVFLADEV